MRGVKYILICFVIVISKSSYGQLSSLEIKKLKLQALETTLKYESSSSISNNDLKDDFIKLFENNEVEILNDVLPDNKLESKVAVKNYIDLIPTYFTYSLKISFLPYDVKLSAIDAKEGLIDVYGTKIISGRENKSQVVYFDTIDIIIQLKYNTENKSMKIGGISINEEPSKYLIVKAVQKVIFKSTPLKNDTIIINKSPFITSDEGAVLVRKIKNEESVIVTTNSEKLIGITNINYNQIQKVSSSSVAKNTIIVPFRLSIFDISPIIGIIPWSMSPVRYENAKNENIASFEFGLNLGVRIHESEKGYWKVVSGINIFNYQYQNSLSEVTYTYQSTDPDASSYYRTVGITNYNENTTLKGYTIPLIVEKGFKIKKKMTVFVGAGMSYNKIVDGSSKTTATAQYSGFYPDLFNIEIKENGVYDFGKYELANTYMVETSPYFWGAQLSAGACYKLSKKVNLSTGLSYRQNVTKMFIKDTKMLSTDSEQLNTLSNAGYSSELKLFILNIGLQYKL